MDGSASSPVGRALHRSPAAEEHERLRVMRRVAALMFVIGGSTAALGAEITARTGEAKFAHLWSGSTFLVCGVIVLLAPARRRIIELLLVVAVPVLGLLIAGSNPAGMAPLFYLWPAVFAAYFCSPRLVGLVLTLSALTLALGLVWNDNHELKIDTFVGTMSSVGLMAVLVATMTRRQEVLRSELATMASTDPLTGLLNRRAFDRHLEALIGRVGSGEPTALVLFDLDHFKQFNDHHGHLAGDAALRAVADVLRREAAADDAIGRFGGEEFTVALADATLPMALAFVNRVAKRIAELDPRTFHGLTVSAGISPLRPADDAGAVFARADRALYGAKAAGRARYAWFDGEVLSVQECSPAF